MAENKELEIIKDPAQSDTSFSQQAGSALSCPGPVVFPMANGADADAWAKEFGYPLEADTGDISVGSMMEELRSDDEAGRFMLEVYDHMIDAKGGESSEEAAAFLTNFMPPNPETGDTRKHFFKLIYGDRMIHNVVNTHSYYTANIQSIYRDGEVIEHDNPLLNTLGNEINIFVAPKDEMTHTALLGLYQSTKTESISALDSAENIINKVDNTNKMKPYLDWLIFGAGVLFVAWGVGSAVGAIRVATTVGSRLSASSLLAFSVSEGTEYITGYIGGKGKGYNPIKQAFKWVGRSVNGTSGAQMGEYFYNTLNIVVGFGGKIGLFGGSLYAATQLPVACQPVDGSLNERRLESQGDAQKTVF